MTLYSPVPVDALTASVLVPNSAPEETRKRRRGGPVRTAALQAPCPRAATRATASGETAPAPGPSSLERAYAPSITRDSSTVFFTEAKLFSQSAFSSALKSIACTFSTPPAPMVAGTPM